MEIYFIYHETDPFPGYLLPGFIGRIDQNENHGLKEYLEGVVKETSGTVLQYHQADRVDLPDPEKEKYDIGAKGMVPLKTGDITPAMARAASQVTASVEVGVSPLKDKAFADAAADVDALTKYNSTEAVDGDVDKATDLDLIRAVLKQYGADILALKKQIKELTRLVLALLKHEGLSK